MTLESVCKIYPRRWHLNENSYSRRRIHLSWLFRFKLLKLYSNILKRVNLIEIRLYAPPFLVFWHIFFETTAQIPEVKFGYLRANTDIWGRANTDICPVRIFALRANNQRWLLDIIGHAKTNILQQNMW
jgi:hypothetical protein